MTHTNTPDRSPLNEQSGRRRGRYLHNTQQTQETNIHALGEIRTLNPSKRAAADPHFRARGHGDRHVSYYRIKNRVFFNSGFIVYFVGVHYFWRYVVFFYDILIFLFITQQPPVGQGLLIIEASRSHSDTPQSVGLLWTRFVSLHFFITCKSPWFLH
jgi:hypothetical protein